jgi:hypothetical protein
VVEARRGSGQGARLARLAVANLPKSSSAMHMYVRPSNTMM